MPSIADFCKIHNNFFLKMFLYSFNLNKRIFINFFAKNPDLNVTRSVTARAGRASLKCFCVSRLCAFFKWSRVSRLRAHFPKNILRITDFASSPIASLFLLWFFSRSWLFCAFLRFQFFRVIVILFVVAGRHFHIIILVNLKYSSNMIFRSLERKESQRRIGKNCLVWKSHLKQIFDGVTERTQVIIRNSTQKL